MLDLVETRHVPMEAVMPESLYPLVILACPVGMGVMMWLMMRGNKTSPTGVADPTQNQAELDRMQAEINQLRVASQDQAGATHPSP